MTASDWINRILEVEEEPGVGIGLLSGEAQSGNKEYQLESKGFRSKIPHTSLL